VGEKILSAFATSEKWLGLGGLDDQQVEIELLLDTADDNVRTAIADKHPANIVHPKIKMSKQWALHSTMFLMKSERHDIIFD
jgi:hypothetical protein